MGSLDYVKNILLVGVVHTVTTFIRLAGGEGGWYV